MEEGVVAQVLALAKQEAVFFALTEQEAAFLSFAEQEV